MSTNFVKMSVKSSILQLEFAKYMNATLAGFITSQFSYCPLVLIFHGRMWNAD